MINWQSLSDTSFSWDKSLLCSRDYNVFQSFGWGEYKKQQGWIPRRYLSIDSAGNIQGMVQILIKKLPFGVVFIWVPGGVVVNFKNSNFNNLTMLIAELINKIRTDYPRYSIRFNFQIEATPDLSYKINQVCLRPYVKINSGFSVAIGLNQPIEQIKKNMKSKHRYYVNSSLRENIDWVLSNDDSSLANLQKIHEEMLGTKQVSLKKISLNEIECMRNCLGEKVQVLTGFLNGIPVTSCLVLIFGRKAFYMIASTSNQGRKISASYAMVERLMQELISINVSDFDFGGIDPVSKLACGVNHFKSGFGGDRIAYLGEWESASSKKIRMAINFGIHLKSSFL